MRGQVTRSEGRCVIRYEYRNDEVTDSLLEEMVAEILAQKGMEVTLQVEIGGMAHNAMDFGRWLAEHQNYEGAILIMNRLAEARRAGAEEWATEFTPVGLEIVKGLTQSKCSAPEKMYDSAVEYLTTLDFGHTDLKESKFDLESAFTPASSASAKAAFIIKVLKSDSPWAKIACLRRDVGKSAVLVDSILEAIHRRVDNNDKSAFSDTPDILKFIVKASRERAAQFKNGIHQLRKMEAEKHPQLPWFEQHKVAWLPRFKPHPEHSSTDEYRLTAHHHHTMEDLRWLHTAIMYAAAKGQETPVERLPWDTMLRNGALYVYPRRDICNFGPKRERQEVLYVKDQIVAIQWKIGENLGIASWTKMRHWGADIPGIFSDPHAAVHRIFDANTFRELIAKSDMSKYFGGLNPMPP